MAGAMTIDIRKARREDLSGLLGLYRQLSPEDPPLDMAEAGQRLEALLGSSLAHLLVAQAGDALAATCLLLIVPNLTRGGKPFALIENVVTDAAHRRRGIGKALIGQALERAWAADCYKVMLATGRSDEGVLRFYEQAGLTRGGKTFFQARRLG
jgi:GNAT superfamily N-acetyltransferase